MNISAYKKKDGLTYYMFHAYVGIDEKTGKTKKVGRRGFKTKKDAQLAYLKLFNELDSSKVNNKFTFREIYELWLMEHKTQVKDSSYIATIGRFQNHILPSIGNYRISAITHADMQKAVNDWALVVKRPNKIKTAAGQVFKYALLHGYIDKDPTSLVKTPKNQTLKDFENYLDFDELKLFLETADSVLSKKWATFMYLLAFTGMRRGEALALEWSDIDFTNQTISITKNLSKSFDKLTISTPKTSTGIRVISMGDILINKLLSYKEVSDSNLVFPNKKGGYIVFSHPLQRIHTVCKKAGLKEISPHGLRHTHCCLLFEAGASIAQVQHRLGHKTATVTLNIYNHVTQGKVKEAAKLFDEKFSTIL